MYLPGSRHFSTFFRSAFTTFTIPSICSFSPRLALYHFPRNLTGSSWIDCMGFPFISILLELTSPLMITKALHFSTFSYNPAQCSFGINLSNKYLVWTIVSVVVVISSINSLLFTWRFPDDNFGPLVSFFTDITIHVIAKENSTTLRVHPVIIPFSTLCHSVVKFRVANLILASL